MTNCNSTLTSASTNHIRWSSRALPFPPFDDRLGTLRASCSDSDVISVWISPNGRKGRRRRNVVIQQKGDEKWIIGCQLFGYRMGRRVLVWDVVEVLGGVDGDTSIVVVYAFITCCTPTLCIDGDRHDDMYAFDVRHVVWAFGESYLFISLFFKILKDVFWLYVGSNCYICDVGVSDGKNGPKWLDTSFGLWWGFFFSFLRFLDTKKCFLIILRFCLLYMRRRCKRWQNRAQTMWETHRLGLSSW